MCACMRLGMRDQSRADTGGADARIDYQRPQQSMAAEQLQADHPHRRLKRPCHEEVLQMRVRQILDWKLGDAKQ